MSIKISELPQASTVNNTDLIPIVQEGTTKQATAGMISPTNEVSFIVCALTSTHRITISQAWSSGAQSVPLDSITLSSGSDYSLNNGKIKVGSKPKVVELSICISPYSLDGDATVTYQGIIRRIRSGTKTNLLNLAMYPYNINKSCYYSGSVITTCEENDEFELALGTSSPTKTVDSGTSANALTIKTLSEVALSQTRTLNAPLMNTGSLVGLGDKAEVTDETLEKTKLDEVTEVKEAEAKTEEIEKEGSGDKR